jgi:hypothetical protein
VYIVLSGSYFTLLKILLQASKSPVKARNKHEAFQNLAPNTKSVRATCSLVTCSAQATWD